VIARRVLIAAIVGSLILLNGCTSFRLDYVNSHPDLDGRTREAILNGRIFIGMTEEQVKVSWGRPKEIHRSVGMNWSREQWVYGIKEGDHYISPTYVYFERGRVIGWED